MSRARIEYDFCPMPRRWYAGWSNHQGLYARGLRAALFELADGGPIPVHGADWLASLCNQMAIHGKDRPNVRKALKQFVADGLIGCDGTHVRGRFLPDAGPVEHRADIETKRAVIETKRAEIDPQPCRNHDLTSGTIPLPLESTPRNDSGRISQTDRQTDKTDHTDARAGATPETGGGGLVPIEPIRKLETEGYLWLQNVLGTLPADLGSWRREYALIAGKPAAERAAVARHVLATPYIAERRSKATPGHLLKFWAQFVEGPRSFEFGQGPAVAKRFAGPSRVATAEEYAADAAGGNDPW